MSYQPHALIDTSEAVLYDYNLAVGDTVTRHVDTFTWRHVVTGIDSCMINGVWHRLWKLTEWPSAINNTSSGEHYEVLEGIGCVNSSSEVTTLLMPLVPRTFFEYTAHIVCFTNQYGQPSVTPALPMYFFYVPVNQFDNTASCTLAVASDSKNEQAVSIYPVPATQATVIRLSSPIHNGSVELYDVLGKLVYKGKLNHQTSIAIGNYINTPGQYFYRITDLNNNQSYTGKFLFSTN